MDQTHFVKSGFFALKKILFDDADNLFGLKRMKIEVILDGNYDRTGIWRVILATGRVAVIFSPSIAHTKEGKNSVLALGGNFVWVWLISIPAFITF